MATKAKRQRLIIAVHGGVVQSVLTDADIDVILVDWDEIKDCDGEACEYATEPLSELDAEAKQELKRAGLTV